MHGSSNTPSLRLNRVSLRLQGRLFFRDIDWTMNPGEQWAVLGPNGCGKTAFAELIRGTLNPSSGSIEHGWDGPREDAVSSVSYEIQQALCDADTRHDISEYLDNAVDPGTTVRALLADAAAEPGEIGRVAARLGIDRLLERGIRFLSSGEMRRTLIARAVLARPRLLILDNPYEGIDAASRDLVAAVVSGLLSDGPQVLFLTRQPADIPRDISHVLLLEHGRITLAGQRENVLANPAVQAAFSPAAPITPEAPPGFAAATASNEPAAALIEMHDVHARYGDNEVLRGVSLCLRTGDHLCISGPNGCGKSTLLSLLCGDNPRAYGQEIRLFGRRRGSGESVWDIKRRFGIVSNQLHRDYPRRTRAFDVVASGFFDTLGLYDDCGPAQRDIAAAWLRTLGLAGRARERFDALSYGEQRMMLIARAMVKSPPVLILDEPCSGLDAANRARVLALVDLIAANSATSILYVSHEREEMPRCINRHLEFRPAGSGYRLVETAPA